jgi:hypothetical protein
VAGEQLIDRLSIALARGLQQLVVGRLHLREPYHADLALTR